MGRAVEHGLHVGEAGKHSGLRGPPLTLMMHGIPSHGRSAGVYVCVFLSTQSCWNVRALPGWRPIWGGHMGGSISGHISTMKLSTRRAIRSSWLPANLLSPEISHRSMRRALAFAAKGFRASSDLLGDGRWPASLMDRQRESSGGLSYIISRRKTARQGGPCQTDPRCICVVAAAVV